MPMAKRNFGAAKKENGRKGNSVQRQEEQQKRTSCRNVRQHIASIRFFKSFFIAANIIPSIAIKYHFL
jgi:hypothetical protein